MLRLIREWHGNDGAFSLGSRVTPRAGGVSHDSSRVAENDLWRDVVSLSRSIEGFLNSYLSRKHEKIREERWKEDWKCCFLETVECDKGEHRSRFFWGIRWRRFFFIPRVTVRKISHCHGNLLYLEAV